MSHLDLLSGKTSRMFPECSHRYRENSAPESFLQSLTARENVLDNAVGMICDKIMLGFGSIRRNAVISQTRLYVESYIRGVYTEVLDIKGMSTLKVTFPRIVLTSRREACQ